MNNNNNQFSNYKLAECHLQLIGMKVNNLLSVNHPFTNKQLNLKNNTNLNNKSHSLIVSNLNLIITHHLLKYGLLNKKFVIIDFLLYKYKCLLFSIIRLRRNIYIFLNPMIDYFIFMI